MTKPAARQWRRKFSRIAVAGILFQGGAATVDSATIVSALVHQLTASSFAVGAAAAISRYGWLFPQLIVAHLAQSRARRMPFYSAGAFGRVICLLCLAALLWLSALLPRHITVALFFSIWTAFAFISGIVAVPYNDIVARSVASERRSRLLAVRFFGGGLLMLLIAGLAHWMLRALPFPAGYALLFLLGAGLLAASAISFLLAGETSVRPTEPRSSFADFLREGLRVLRQDDRFRLFLYARWLSGTATMALPFYILQATRVETLRGDVALFFAAQTVGSLLSNPLWGWWGDRRGKASLLVLAALLGTLAPALTLWWMALGWREPGLTLSWFGMVFFVIGAAGNGDTIAQLGYLMELSPDDRRPAYSGYFNALAAPAALLPMVGALVAQVASFAWVFAISLCAACFQVAALRRLIAVKS
ncbi:MAG: MFS transporter [SAR324 cluster bacterium]|nr:MFS transporter [SAR324 cluster bacterium]